ncbi:hypothetical protein AALD01_02650 [Oscillospiraceae bacterium 21-37]
MASNVIFKIGTQEQYNALAVKDPNTLYWLHDVLELRKGEDLYGKGKEATALASGLMSAADKAKLDALSAGGAAGLTAVDASVVLASGENGTTIGVQVSKESGNALSLKEDGLFVSSAAGGVEFSIEKQTTPEDGYSATYKLKRSENGTDSYVGESINIPKDAVLSGGTYEIVDTADSPYTGAEVGDPYVDLVVANAEESHIYIPLKGLVDTVKAGDGITVVNNTVSVKLDAANANGLAVSADGLSMAVATTTTAGAMSAADKANLDSVMSSIVWGDLSDEESA